MFLIAFFSFILGCFIADNLEYMFTPHCSFFETKEECQIRIGADYVVLEVSKNFFVPFKKI